ncbi:MAG: DUF2782 domain-containing protein [Methylococcaceae bacterium]
MRYRILVMLTTISFVASAENPEPAAVPAPPKLPKPVEDGEKLEPDVTIIRKGDKNVQEYRINGELYMVKIVPDIGPAYYLVDSNGDGNMDVRRSDLQDDLKIPRWVLFSW